VSIGILICDDQALVRAGFRKLLEAAPGVEVVGEAEDGLQAVELAARRAPAVVMMDIRMPRLDGIEATRRIVARSGPTVRVLMLTTFGHDDYVFESLRAGASGFLLKDAPPEDLLAAIRIVAGGDALLAPAVTRTVIDAFTRSAAPRPELAAALDELTAREREVLGALARGLSNLEIAGELMVSEATVKTHTSHVLAKLGVRDRVQAVIYAYESGLMPAPR
jgi:DNA-binding NarL/FixJ family response regulator